MLMGVGRVIRESYWGGKRGKGEKRESEEREKEEGKLEE